MMYLNYHQPFTIKQEKGGTYSDSLDATTPSMILSSKGVDSDISYTLIFPSHPTVV